MSFFQRYDSFKKFFKFIQLYKKILLTEATFKQFIEDKSFVAHFSQIFIEDHVYIWLDVNI